VEERKDGSFLDSLIFFSQEENLNRGNWEEMVLFNTDVFAFLYMIQGVTQIWS
jgi:hypothetical protein